jgi:hypothetical protein
MVVRCGVKPVAAVAPRPRPGHHRPKCAVEVPLSCHEDCIHAAAVAYEQFNAHGISWCYVRMHNTCACHVMSSSAVGLGCDRCHTNQIPDYTLHSCAVRNGQCLLLRWLTALEQPQIYRCVQQRLKQHGPMPVPAGTGRGTNTSSQTDPALVEGRGSDTPPITGIGIHTDSS